MTDEPQMPRLPYWLVILDATGTVFFTLGLLGVNGVATDTFPVLQDKDTSWSLLWSGSILLLYAGVRLIRTLREQQGDD